MKRLIALLIFCMLLSACAPATAAPTATAVEPVAAAATDTPVPATATATPTQPPTETPLPTATATLTPTPVPETISLDNASRLEQVRSFGNGRILKLAWSPDSKTLLALTTIHLIAIDPATAKEVWRLETGRTQRDVAYSTDGKEIVTVSAGGSVTRRSASDGKIVSEPTEQIVNVVALAVSTNGAMTATTNVKRETAILDVAAGKEIYNNHGGGMPAEVAGVALAPDGAWFVTSGYDARGPRQQIQLWETDGGKFLRGMAGINNDFITEVSVSPDSAYLGGISRLRLTKQPQFSLLVWDASRGTVVKKLTREYDISTYAFLPDSSGVLLALLNGEIETVSLPDGESKAGFRDHADEIAALAVSPDGKRLASADVGGVLKLWDMQSHKETGKFDLKPSTEVAPYLLLGNNYLTRVQRPSGMGVANDGSFVAIPSGDRNSINLIDPITGKVTKTVGNTNGEMVSVAVSPDGRLVAGMDLENGLVLNIWAADTGRMVKTIATDHTQLVSKILFTPDSKSIATLAGGSKGELYIWNVETGKKTMTGSGQYTMEFSPDGKTLVTDNVDFGLYFWDPVGGKQIRSVSADWVYDIDFAPDGSKIAVSGYEMHKDIDAHTNLIGFLDTKTNKLDALQLLGDKSSIMALRYAPDGKLLVSVDEYGNVTLWDVQSGQALAQVNEVTVAPISVDFLPGGRTLVVAGGDGTVHFLEVK